MASVRNLGRRVWVPPIFGHFGTLFWPSFRISFSCRFRVILGLFHLIFISFCHLPLALLRHSRAVLGPFHPIFVRFWARFISFSCNFLTYPLHFCAALVPFWARFVPFSSDFRLIVISFSSHSRLIVISFSSHFRLLVISFSSPRHLVSVSFPSHFRLISVSSMSLSSQNRCDCKVHVTSCLTGVSELIAIPATGGLGPV